jgi:hypothetical protein
MVGILAACLAGWLILSPLLIGSYAVIFRDPLSGEDLACQASFAPARQAAAAVSVCAESCEEAGMIWIRGEPPIVVDWSPEGWAGAQRLWRSFIPPPCLTRRP